MLETLVLNNSFVSNAYTEDPASIKYQLHYKKLEDYFIQQNYDQNDQLYVIITVSILQLIYIHVGTGKYPTFNVR